MRPSVVVSGCSKATDGVLCTCRGKPAQPASSIAAVSRSNRGLRIQPSYQADFAAMHTQRRIRSFVLRAGRTTPAQERALSELWPVYGIDLEAAPLDLKAVFGRESPRCLEIGFGAGEVIGALAETNPHLDYL